MNRADRREKGIPDDVYKVLINDIQNKREEMRLEIIQQLWGVIIVSLRDEFQFFKNEKHGVNRINRFIDRFNENMLCKEEQNIDLEDFNKWCEENNIKFQVREMTKEVL